MYDNLDPEILYQFNVWALAACFLIFKMWTNTAIQGWGRLQSGQLAHPEDYAAFAKVSAPPHPRETKLIDRGAACWRNDLENIPMFLIILLAYILVGANTDLVIYCSLIFCLARAAHTYALVRGVQPMRVIVYSLAMLATVTLAISTLLRALPN